MMLKVCGMREPENIRDLLELPIDFMGLIFYKKSDRYVPDDMAAAILAASEGKKVQRVGVFVDEDIDIVVQKVAKFKLQYVQLHGNEHPDYCYDLLAKSARTFGCDDELKLIKAFSVDKDFDFAITKNYTAYCTYFLFDTKGSNPGGNGATFDWQLLEQYEGRIPFLLSGGLGEDSVTAITALPFPNLVGIDLNSKFEVAPALKDVEKLKRFIYPS